MRLGDGGGDVGGLLAGQWSVDPDTGVVELTEAALARLINTDPIDKWYILDPEPIARGQFAVVYHVRHRITGEEFAAKFSSRWRLGSDCTTDIVHEIAVCAMLKPTQRTVQLQDVFRTETEFVLVMEFAAGGDLQTLLDEDMVPYERDVISFTRQLLEGLVFIHEQNIVHLDIKPQNLVLMGEFPECAVKLCDFEISRVLTPGREVREILGTPDYVAPEILHYEPITKKTDMWSLGVLTYVLLTGFLPFGGENDQETFLQISKGELDFPAELFEDISPEAIDFIKRLLLRQPERRMSARECLSHPWMKKEMNRPTRPTTLNLSTTLSSAPPPVPSAPGTPITPVPVTPLTPAPMTPIAPMTPMSAVPSEVTTPSRDIGLPPFHPNSPLKHSPSFTGSISTLTSPVSAMPPVPPSSLQRQESRVLSKHNLERLRSMSKSREVLSERIQMSNLKKTISKSRERLFDAKLGISRSRERLMGLRSLSQSVEALTALSRLNQGNSRYQSCNNIFLPMLAPSEKEDDVPCRMYKSLAAIDQIDGIECTHKLGYFESRFCKDDEDYNDHVTRHNTNMNSVFMPQDASKSNSSEIASEARLRGGGRGGRSADVCDKRCTRHSHRQPEAQHTQKIPKVNRAERMKREAQRRRKERKEREREEKEKEKNKPTVSEPEVAPRSNNKTSHDKPAEGASSPVGRRGSVSHVEQRLAERHERQQERLEKQEREERRCSVSRRRGSVDCDRSSTCERTRTSKNSSGLGVSHERPRSITPTRRQKGKKGSNEGSDVSQASSMESVDGNLDSPRSPTRPKRPTSLNIPEIKILPKPSPKSEDENDNIVKQESQGDNDEAYVSLEEPSLFIRNRCIENNDTNEADIRENKQETTRTQEALETIQNLVIKEAGELDLYDEKDNTEANEDQNQTLQVVSDRGLANSGELTVIREEDDDSTNKSPRTYLRSVSNSSDFGSMVSEGSESSMDREDGPLRSPGVDSEFHSEWKGRFRSMSIQSGCHVPNKSRGRARSNSVHLETTVNNRARPWGDLCNGAIARAMEKFNITEEAMTPVGRTIHQRRLSTPVISPTEEEAAFIS